MLRGPAIAGLVAVSGCSSKAAPWDEASGGSPKFGADATEAPAPATAPAAVASDGRLESGGIFVDCRGGLAVTADAIRDVTRLGLACGPVAGMKATPDGRFEGTLSVGSADLVFPFKLEKGRCYRVFVASESAAAEITVDVMSGHELPIASESTDAGLGLVPATRPLCALGDDTATLHASMRCSPVTNATCPKTGVRFAIEVWSR